MGSQLKKKYGLFTAIAMVVGIVIGSGVFFKAQVVLQNTKGNLATGIIAWLVVGFIMLCCVYTFSVLATKYSYVNGLVDYAEGGVGKKYGYYVAWFMAAIYYPGMTSVLAWVSARYVADLFGWDITGGECMVIACFFLVMSYAINALSPIIAGKFQVATTVVKLIPLVLVAVVGIVVGLVGKDAMLVNNITGAPATGGKALWASIVSVAFAYEGWIIATSINGEIKDSKKNLPKALLIGSAIIVVIYIAYFIGLAGTVSTADLVEGGSVLAFQKLLGAVGGKALTAVVVVSCLGTLNGLMVAVTRGVYAMTARNMGPNPEIFGEVDQKTNMPTNAAILGLALTAFWMLYFYGANLVAKPWFGNMFSFDSSELPIITIYLFYIPIFVSMMIKQKDLNPVKRFVMPAVSICGCVFMVVAAALSARMKAVGYLVVFAVIMMIGAFFSKEKINK